jgi:predicted lipoprotein with Yx(FWY)xxD motif
LAAVRWIPLLQKISRKRSCLNIWGLEPVFVDTSTVHYEFAIGDSRRNLMNRNPLFTNPIPQRTVALFGAVTLAATLLLGTAAGAIGTSSPALRYAHVSGFPGALVNHSFRSLYALSAEKSTKLVCDATCRTVWIPLLVKKSVTNVGLGPSVKGKIGFVSRSSTMKQVTFNSYPVYTYTGDSGALQSTGEAIHADGGTWYLIKAGSGSSTSTLYTAAKTSMPTTSYSYGY